MFTLALLAAVSLSGGAAGQLAPPPVHARVGLIAERAAFVPGRPASLGLLFQLDREWHICWRTLGDSGQPPVVPRRLPEGARASDLGWPVPERIEVAGLVDCGYTRSQRPKPSVETVTT